MARNAEDVQQGAQERQSIPEPPKPESVGMSPREASKYVEGLLDDDGHFNPDGQVSRGHPDYDEGDDERAQRPRDERGRFKADGEDEADDAEIAAAEENVDGSDEDTEAESGDTDEGLDASADDEAESSEEETADQLKTLSDFAEALDVPLDQLKESLEHTFSAAGEEVTVTLAELEKGYQKDADYRRSTAKLAEERQALEREAQTRMQQFEANNHYLANQMQMAENIVAQELNDPRLEELRQTDPAEWTARREEIGQKLNYLRQARMQAAQAYDNHMRQQLMRTREQEQKALLSAIPDFGKEHSKKAKEALASVGMNEHEINNVLDHRLVKAAVELADLRSEVAELRELRSKAQNTVKRVKKTVPKLQKPTKQTRKSASGIKRDNVARLRKRAAQSGRVEDAAKVIEQLI